MTTAFVAGQHDVDQDDAQDREQERSGTVDAYQLKVALHGTG